MSFLSSIFGIGRGKPSQTVMTQKLPEEIAPFAKEMLEEAQTLYKQKLKEGYADYKGDTIAGFTPEQKQAMEGIKGLVGTSAPLMDEAIGLTKGLTDQFTAEEAQKYMSPYQQAVTDIEKREAQKVFERDIMPQFEKQAVEAGGMSGMGSRAGIQAAQLGQAQMQQLGDIQTKGSQRAYEDALRQFQNQKERERLAASGLMEAGPKKFKAGMLEQGALQTVGEQKQDLAQTALDEAYLKFIQKQQYPAEQLAQYSGFITMNPYAGLKSQTTTATPYKPSFGQQLLSIGTQLGGAYLGGPAIYPSNMFKPRPPTPRPSGKTGGGIASLVYRDNGGRIDEAFPSNPRSLREEDPELAAQTNLERRIAQASKYGLRNPEQQRARQQAEAQAKLDFLRRSGGGNKPFAQTAISDLLRSFGRGIIREDQNVAKEFKEISDERRKGQKERQKLLDAQEMANITAEFATEDEIFSLPQKLLKKLREVEASDLDRETKEALRDKYRAQILDLKRGKKGKGRTLDLLSGDEAGEKVKSAKSMMKGFAKILANQKKLKLSGYINTLVEADSDILNPIIIAAIEEAENDNRVTFSEALQKAIKRHYELNKGVI